MSVTQKDIAERLGVSPGLVKFALNGSGRVNAVTRARIIAEAEKMGYHSGLNISARRMAARRHGTRVRTNIIAAITQIPMFNGTPISEVPFFKPLLQGIERQAAEHGLDLFFCSFHQGRLPRLVRDGEVDGLICLMTTNEEIASLSIPIVGIGAQGPGIYGIRSDDQAGAEQATQHLIDLGHREIGYVGFYIDADFPASTGRYAGFHKTLEKNGIDFNASHNCSLVSAISAEAGAAAVEDLWGRDASFTALLCFNDIVAMGAVEALAKKGLNVPHDVSVVGFDNVSEQYNFSPALTSIDFDRLAMGKRSVELIIEACEQGNSVEPFDELFPTRLVQHNSTAEAKNSLRGK